MESSDKFSIAFVVGEASGDALGASLMRELKARLPQVSFVGIGGEKMKAEGLHSFFEMDRLSMMGVVEPLLRLPELLRMRHFIIQTFSKTKPDLYIGIDAPDFNLNIERILKSRGVKTMHYVSPTIWAWRPWRIKKIVRALNHILLIFPFEPDIYKRYNEQHHTQLGYNYVGHPMAEEFALSYDKIDARRKLNIGFLNQEMVAILPGSRDAEIKLVGPYFIKTAELLYRQNPNRIFVAAMLNEKKAALFQSMLDKIEHTVPIIIVLNKTRLILQACDAAMVVSGTATLEAALTKRPFIVGYKLSTWQYHVAKRLIKTRYISMPNIIADKPLVMEYIQGGLDPIKMADELNRLLESPDANQALIKEFEALHQTLKQNGSQKAAKAVLSLIGVG